MRILYVAPNIPVPGAHGGSTHVTEVVRALRQEGHEVCLLARRGSHGERTHGIGFGTGTGAGGYALAALHFPAAYRIARRFRPQAIYERFSAQGLGVVLGRLLRVPVLSMVLDSEVNLLTLEGADRLVTTAPHLMGERYRAKMEEVSWGANTDLFRPADPDSPGRREIRARHHLGQDTFALAYTGAFYPWHGLEELVEAVAALEQRGKAGSLRILLVGDGKLREAIEKRIRQAGVGHRMTMVGRVPYEQVPDYINACDGCVAPYNPARHPELRERGMYFDPLKVFEYLACGKPTITLDSENIRRLFRHDVHALLVRPGDAEALADTITDLLHRPDRGRSLGEAGRALVQERYSWRAHGHHLSRLFQELVARQAGRRLRTPA